MATLKSEFGYTPQVASDHILAYFQKKIIWGSLGYKGIKMFDRTQGETITFPYWKKLGDAEDGVENTALTVDDLGDATFTATVKEIGKAAGITDSARIASGATREEWDSEALRQIGRVFAEKVDADLLAEITTSNNHKSVRSVTNKSITGSFDTTRGLSSLSGDRCNIRALHTSQTQAFGDRAQEVSAVVLHSRCWNDIATDGTAGFLQADALDPFFGKQGFQGRDMWGAAWFINDNVPSSTVTVTDNSTATQQYHVRNVVFLKPRAYGFILKRDAMVERDRDILKRVDVLSGTHWYAVKSFHNQLTSQNDERIAFAQFATDERV